jgi:hypothetical protein
MIWGGIIVLLSTNDLQTSPAHSKVPPKFKAAQKLIQGFVPREKDLQVNIRQKAQPCEKIPEISTEKLEMSVRISYAIYGGINV